MCSFGFCFDEFVQIPIRCHFLEILQQNNRHRRPGKNEVEKTGFKGNKRVNTGRC